MHIEFWCWGNEVVGDWTKTT